MAKPTRVRVLAHWSIDKGNLAVAVGASRAAVLCCLSAHAEELLQEAERREVGTKHLLLALTGSDVVRAVPD